MMPLFKGCYTALITPFGSDLEVDWEGLRSLVEFQCQQGISGIVAVGTTGESPTLAWEEHHRVIESVFQAAPSRTQTIAGTGSNSSEEALQATKQAADMGIRAALLVDPYYNGPSSLEVRREYYEPIAEAVPQVQLIPYIIPGRTGTQLLPQDLAMLAARFENVRAVKEATGSLENARSIRALCGPQFTILSGDDDKTLVLMKDSAIRAAGVISVVSNVVPRAVQNMVSAALEGRWEAVEELGRALQPLFQLVTVRTEEATSNGPVSARARNPLPIKTLMQVLGMPSGRCRRPLGRMTRQGLAVLLDGVRRVWESNPEILEPVEEFFDVSLDERLHHSRNWEGLAYDGY